MSHSPITIIIIITNVMMIMIIVVIFILQQEEFVKCKNFSKLVPLNDREHSKLSDSTWGVCDDRGACLDPMMSSRLQPQCSKETGSDILGSGCGKLFSVLLELLYCPWVSLYM